MAQIHKSFTTEQVKTLLIAYGEGHLSRDEIINTIKIGRARFYAILKSFREDPQAFSIDYHRNTKPRLASDVEARIHSELLRDKALVDDKDLPIGGYNYAALIDRLKKEGIQVSTPTIIARAKEIGCYQAKKKKREAHDRVVSTSAVGDLIQHDASIHK